MDSGKASGAARVHAMPFGAALRPDGWVEFRLWAPDCPAVGLQLDGEAAPLPMVAGVGGWHALRTNRAGPGSHYRFVLPDGLAVADPASRFQPHDVHGPSEVVDPAAYRWQDLGWTGRPWESAVFYELHLGSFTPAGTFRGAIDRLDHLVELGISALEIMPVADFSGRRGWGYDGVLPFAPDGAYGRPEDFKALIDAAHARGLMVFLDVVYNHFGPDGNYLSRYASGFFTRRHHTPWGAAINYDGPDSRPVRDFVIHNALYWIEEFHLDGLRLDAVHAILDDSAVNILTELAERVHQAAAGSGRQVHLVLENGDNQSRFLARDGAGGSGAIRWYAGQWNDDLHHGLHAAITGEAGGYYAPYAGDRRLLARALAEGFAFQGEPCVPLSGGPPEPRGEPSAHLPATAFVGFLQNHDQIGNRAFGERITRLARPEAVRAAAGIYLLAPQVPMLFMGEEWAAPQPFLYFCDFDDGLADAVRNGRREEFAAFPEFASPEARERIPDPAAEATALAARLDWQDCRRQPGRDWLDWYRRVLAVRRAEIVPRLAGMPGGTGRWRTDGPGGVFVSWRLGDASALHLMANLAEAALDGVALASGRVLWSEGAVDDAAGRLGPWSIRWSLEAPEPP